MASQKNTKGFTLVELIVVMVIIGILATLSIGNYVTIRAKARDAKRKHDLETIAKTLETWMNDHGEYPAEGTSDGQCCNWNSPLTDGTTEYIPRLPQDSRNPNFTYIYTRPNNTSYQLSANLENENDPDIDNTLTASCTGNTCTMPQSPPDPDCCNYQIINQ